MKLKSGQIAVLIVFLVLLFDQALKIWVKTTMTYNQDIMVLGLDWFRLHFTENPGMAFGLEFGGSWGKLALSLFRIVAIGFIIYYIRLLIQQGAHKGLIASISLILAGAIGNILDSAFYGLIFNESMYHQVATMFPEEGGYAGFLHGKVVDMLYFPLYKGNLFGIFGERYFEFFRPVFNIADSSITVGVVLILLFQKRFFASLDQKDTVDVDTTGNEVVENIEVEKENISDDVVNNDEIEGNSNHSEEENV